jgi:hypothetical protein
MAKAAVKSPGARRGRPALKLGSPKRSSFNTRLRTEIKQQLETEAQIAGRSLSEEIEFRLGRSLQQEADSGGRHLHGLLLLLVGVAEIVQERTGKSASDDWKTGVAVGRAWKRLIHDWLPSPPAELIAEMGRLSDAVPDRPERPEAPARGGLLVRPATDEEWEAYEKGKQNFEKDLETFLIAFDKHDAAARKIEGEFNEAIGIGEETLGLLSGQEK